MQLPHKHAYLLIYHPDAYISIQPLKVKVYPAVILLVMTESKGGAHSHYEAEEPVLSGSDR